MRTVCCAVPLHACTGSLGKPETWLTGEFRQSLGTTRGLVPLPKLDIVYPSVDDVRGSVEGYAAGASLPFSERFGVVAAVGAM